MRMTLSWGLAGLITASMLVMAGPADAELPTRESVARVQHSVVWDAGRRDAPRIKIISAGLDGSDQRVIFRRDRGFVLGLELNPLGTEVAMAPFRASERRRPELLVVDVVTGARRDLLTRDRRFAGLGAIGWSPDGRRLVFEGWVDEGDERNGYLWTIHRDGHGLNRLRMLPRTEDGQWVDSSHLVWTGRGIYYNGVNGLMVLTDGAVREILPGATAPMLSGNGRWLFMVRNSAHAKPRVWRMRPGGSSLERTDVVVGSFRSHWVSPLVPSRSGARMLSGVSGAEGISVVLHDAMSAPREGDRRLPFLENVYVLDWN